MSSVTVIGNNHGFNGKKTADSRVMSKNALPEQRYAQFTTQRVNNQNTSQQLNGVKDNSSSVISDASALLMKPIQDRIDKEIDKIAKQVREKLAEEKGINQAQVKELDVAEYMLGMPTQNLKPPMEDMAATMRNGLIIGALIISATIAVAAVVSKMSSENK